MIFRWLCWRTWVLYGTVIGMVILVLLLYLPQLQSYALRDWDESIYAQVARESHDWFAFTWLGQGTSSPANLWFEKPPLVEWLIKFSYLVFGDGEFAARFWFPLFGAGILVVCFYWGLAVWRSAAAGLVAAASLLFCYHFLLAIGLVTYDVPLGFFIVLALYSYARAERVPRYWVLFWVSVACAVLVKNVLGFLPVLVVLIDSVLTGRPFVFEKWFWRGALIGALVVIPWHLVETFRFGARFWKMYLYYHVFERFTTGIENNGQPWWYYFAIFKQLPYAVLAVAGVLWGSIRFVRAGAKTPITVPLVASLVIFAALSASKTKGDLYIVLVYPFLSLLIGWLFYELLQRLNSPWLRGVLVTIFVAAGVFSVVQFNAYRLVRMRGSVYEDVKALGTEIAARGNIERVYYISYVTKTDVISALPALVYYTGLPVREASLSAIQDLKPSKRTPTHTLFVRDKEVYVQAVRFVP